MWVDFPVSVVYQQHGARQSTAESPILPSSGRVAPAFFKEGEEEGIITMKKLRLGKHSYPARCEFEMAVFILQNLDSYWSRFDKKHDEHRALIEYLGKAIHDMGGKGINGNQSRKICRIYSELFLRINN